MKKEFSKLYREKNPKASQKEIDIAFNKLKKKYVQKGGFSNYDLIDANLRYAAGVSSLNSGVAELPRQRGGSNNLKCTYPEDHNGLTKDFIFGNSVQTLCCDNKGYCCDKYGYCVYDNEDEDENYY